MIWSIEIAVYSFKHFSDPTASIPVTGVQKDVALCLTDLEHTELICQSEERRLEGLIGIDSTLSN